MNNAKRIEILKRLRDHNPHPKTELHYSSPFELLVAVTLSAQATDVSVNKATAKLFPVANTPKAIVNIGVEGLKHFIKTIGLYNNKAVNVVALSQKLLDEYTRTSARGPGGIGITARCRRKTANVVLNTAFGWPTIAVDTHIFRVSNRTNFAPGKNVQQVEDKLLKVVPAEFKVDVHHWLILHGRYTCIARKPRCGSCIIEDLCEFKEKVYPE
ncbi:MAG: endonuclease III [Shewanella fodinae]|nr:endonuclease III [Shewanella fodinae]